MSEDVNLVEVKKFEGKQNPVSSHEALTQCDLIKLSLKLNAAFTALSAGGFPSSALSFHS